MAFFDLQDASGASFFDGIYDVFVHVPEFLQKKMQHQKLSKNHQKTSFPLGEPFLP